MYFINKIKINRISKWIAITIVIYLFLYTYLITDNVYAFNTYNIYEMHYYIDEWDDIDADTSISVNNTNNKADADIEEGNNILYNGDDVERDSYFTRINYDIKGDDISYDYLYILYIISKENKYIYKNYPELSKFIAYKIEQASYDDRFKKFGLTQKSLLFLLLGIIKIESNFHPVALSYANAAGLMQIHIPTWRIKYSDAYNVEFNIFMGKEILHHYMELSNGSIKSALFRYLGAPSYSYAINVLTKANAYMRQYKIFINEINK